MYQFMHDNNQKRLLYAGLFSRTFGISIGKFWNIITGFDVIAFDEWLQTPDGTSTSDYLDQKYGEDARKLIEFLIS